jgi:hypothetical protein
MLITTGPAAPPYSADGFIRDEIRAQPQNIITFDTAMIANPEKSVTASVV